MKRIILTALMVIGAALLFCYPWILHYFLGYEKATPIVNISIAVLVIAAGLIAVGLIIAMLYDLSGKILNKKK